MTGTAPSTSVSPCQYHSAIAVYWFHINSNQKDKRAKTGNFQRKQCSLGYRGGLDRKVLSGSLRVQSLRYSDKMLHR